MSEAPKIEFPSDRLIFGSARMLALGAPHRTVSKLSTPPQRIFPVPSPVPAPMALRL
nr:MAG TPA_asm: hypothetical protein [Caudoviricetes sp.]